MQLGRLGLRIPRDISLIGFGGTRREGTILRRLTSIVMEEAAIGRKAVELLHEMRKGARAIEDNEVFTSHWVSTTARHWVRLRRVAVLAQWARPFADCRTRGDRGRPPSRSERLLNTDLPLPYGKRGRPGAELMRLIETPQLLSVCIIDARPANYTAFLKAEQSSLARLEFLSHGRDALRRARIENTDLWIVNVELPDMSGLELCAMLKTHAPGSTVYMVTDNYCAADERTAWVRGASLFSAKPVHGPHNLAGALARHEPFAQRPSRKYRLHQNGSETRERFQSGKEW